MKEVKLGVPLEEALINMARAVGSDDLELVATSTNIARQLGGNMAEMFETISATIRERFRLEGKIDALTARASCRAGSSRRCRSALGMVLNYMRPGPDGADAEITSSATCWSPLIVLWKPWASSIIRRIVNIDV